MLSKIDTIKQKILNDIRSGRLAPGDALYSRHQFMKRYKCSRGSIDRAITELTRDGYVYSRQGAGTYVAGEPPRSEEIRQVFVVQSYHKNSVGRVLAQTSALVAELQSFMPCYLIHYDDVNINLNRIIRPGNAVIWNRPSYEQMMAIDYIANAGIPQMILGRVFNDYNYITTDSRAGILEGLKWLCKDNDTRELAFVSRSYDTRYPYIAERQIEFFEACVELDLKIRQDWLMVGSKEAGEDNIARNAATKFFTGSECPELIYIDFSTAALAFLAQASALGREPGRDFKLLTFDSALGLEDKKGVAMIVQSFIAPEKKAIEWVMAKRHSNAKIKIKPELVVCGDA